MTDQPTYPIPIAGDEEIAEFIARFGKPYDAESDGYDRQAFVADIREGKNDPIYNAHSYHTKVPPRAIIPYILHYTEPGDIVLDPFCGSGMTGVAALLCEEPPADILAAAPGAKKGARRAILNDLSPAACHIAYNYCTPVDVDALKAEFERIKAAVKDEFDWLYGTEHYEPAVGVYDPTGPEVARRLKNPPAGAAACIPLPDEERAWTLIDRAEVERRMGPEALAKQPLQDGVERFIAIPATIQYTIWSDVYKCQGMVTVEEPTGRINRKTGQPTVKKIRRPRGCGATIVLWDVARDADSGEVRESFSCAMCHQKWKKSQLSRLGSTEVLTSYIYTGLNEVKRRKTTALVEKACRAYRTPTVTERARVAEIETRRIPHWFPETEWCESREMWRGGHREAQITRASHFFTKRNLWALSRLWKEVRGALPSVRLCFTAIVPNVSRLYRYRTSGGGGPSLNLYVPSLNPELNALRCWEDKSSELIRGLSSREKVVRGYTAVACAPAQRQSALPDDSIDYVWTDPPFGSNIFYADCSFLWESWLGMLTDQRLEAVWNQSRTADEGGKSLGDYAQTMAQAFVEMHRVLKPGRWATVAFNNSNGQVFEAIKRGVRHAGFLIENMVFLDKVQKTFKQLKGEKGEEDVVGHDVIFNLRKPVSAKAKDDADHVAPPASVANDGHRAPSLEQNVSGALRQHLASLADRIAKDPKTYSDEHRTTPFLNTVLMNALIPRGVNVERLNLPYIERVCARYFRKVDNRWYLPDEAAAQQNADGARGLLFRAPTEDVEIGDEASALAWLRGRLNHGGMRIGELRPHWMRATVKLTGDLSTRLEQFLREHFWLDRQTHRWRMPTPEELSQMDDSEQRRARHEAERFLAGNSRRAPGDADLLDWIDHLYRAATRLEEEAAGLAENGQALELPDEAQTLYGMMARLLAGVLKEHVEESRLALARRQCRIARAKLAAQQERDEAARGAALAADDDRPLFASIDADD